MFFAPTSMAIIGASREPGKLGYEVLQNMLKSGFKGSIYPVNPNASEILGLKCYPSILDVLEPVDMVVITIPAKFVAKALDECGQRGVKGAIIITAGFREVGSAGAQLERELIRIGKMYKLRLVGPNVLGLIDTVTPLNASFSAQMPKPGTISFLSQSGALCTAILDWADAHDIGFARFLSIGNKADVNEIDLLEAWHADGNTHVIIAYLEGITDGGRFIDVARQVTQSKPVIALKSGSTGAGARAASSHTGTLAGSARAYDAAFKQCGVIRATSVQDLFDYSIAFAYQPLLPGDRIAIVTNAGGPGIMGTDAIEDSGLKLASLKEETQQYLAAKLPAAANTHNPIDVLGDSLADRYGMAVEAALKDPNVDGVLVILTPQVMTQPVESAQAVCDAVARLKGCGKPVLGCWMGQRITEAGAAVLSEHKIPNYQFPERAAAAFKAMSTYRKWRERPPLELPSFDVDKAKVKAVFDKARAESRLGLGDFEARAVMEA